MTNQPTCIRHRPWVLVPTLYFISFGFSYPGIAILSSHPLVAAILLCTGLLFFFLSTLPGKIRICLDKRADALSVEYARWYSLRYSIDSRCLSDICGVTHLFPVMPSGNGFVDITEAGSLVITMKHDRRSLTIFPGNSAPLGISVEKIGRQIARFLNIPFEQHAMYEGYL